MGAVADIAIRFNCIIPRVRRAFEHSVTRLENIVSEYEVTCISKPDRFSPHEHITHIGNSAGNWRLTRESAIQRIDGGQEQFYTIDMSTGRKVYIGVVRNDGGKAPYLRTHADGKWKDNLLAQQECGAGCKVVS